MKSTIDNKGIFKNLGSPDMWPEAIQTYKQASEAMLLAFEKQTNDYKEFRSWRAIYTFLKSFTDATIEVNQNSVTASINGKVAVIKNNSGRKELHRLSCIQRSVEV